jgi:hypothetical protein
VEYDGKSLRLALLGHSQVPKHCTSQALPIAGVIHCIQSQSEPFKEKKQQGKLGFRSCMQADSSVCSAVTPVVSALVSVSTCLAAQYKSMKMKMKVN